VIAVTLNDPDDWLDHRNMLNYGLEVIKQIEIKPQITEYDVPVVGGEAENLHVSIQPYVVNTLNDTGFLCEVNLPKFIYAPIKKGEKIGSVVYKNGDNVAGIVDIFAQNDIKVLKIEEKYLEILQNAKYIFKNIWEK
jgi:D-alanyl-D-alanine carboxypeptidase/D-alanyl-D-alanine carboxypeptidase (penicillin-binding protein 5/6)